ncbi:MAG: DUF4625 domain-containing protein [Bacteroidia bacterium]|jgi:hypothetical protein|nr:DUF4625 domain-containing protein [Bacteroidia bacterium]
MNRILHYGLLLVLFTFSLASCKKDSQLPRIKSLQIGYDNSGQVIAGTELHLEAEIEAPEKIDRVELEIHAEGGHKVSLVIFDGEWHLEKVYDNFKGLKNTDFHEHVDVPLTAPAGDYHVHLSVIDQKGNKGKAEGELKVLLPTR